MNRRWLAGGWRLAAALSFLVALALHRSPGMQRWDDLLIEHYSRWSAHEESSDIVVIGIDAYSLTELNRWPWPRGHHARLLDVLRDASPERVFVDIDFSTRSNAADDEQLAAALARWDRGRIVLPVFVQPASGTDGQLVVTRPLDTFAARATLGSVNLVPDPDAIVRRIPDEWDFDGARVPAVYTVLAGGDAGTGTMPIDFSIAPTSFAYHSYVDVMRGLVPLEQLRGRTILIGATAVELGDMQPVPVHRALPGVVIQALATQTARSGPVTAAGPLLPLVLLAACALLLARISRRLAWYWNLGITALAMALAIGIGMAAFLLHVRLDVLPLLVAAAGNFAFVTLGSLDAATLRTRLLARLARKRGARYHSVFESSHDGILRVDQSGNIVSANAAARSLLAGGTAQLIAQPLRGFLPEAHEGSGIGDLAAMNGRILETSLATCEGGRVPVEISTTQAGHDDGRHFTLILRDLRERRRQEAQLRHQATHDALTGLANRALFVTDLASRIADPATGSFSVLSLNLARFKFVIDTLGHEVGDMVLAAAATRLAAVMTGRGLIARLDGHAFAMLVECGGSHERLMGVVREIIDAVRKPVECGGVPIGVGVNIGIARCPGDGAEPVALLRNAGIAMQAARRGGEDLAFYDVDHDGPNVRRLALLGELRDTIEMDALALHYQPKVSLNTGRVDSVEALLRWEHPVHGMISPGEMIPLIEPTELLRPLTDWTIRRALAQQRAWAAQGLHLRMAVNLSARLLQDLNFPARLGVLLAEHGTAPGSLELEITESAMLLDADRALLVGHQIRMHGVQLSIDDYGTGHSSLSYLRDLSVGTLKLDRTFVDNLEDSEGNRIIVESTLALAHALQLQVVAEGISTAWQAAYLAGLGYDYGQGYFFAKPLEAGACARWISERNAAHPDARARVA